MAAPVDSSFQMVTVVFKTSAVAVDNEAEHARPLEETIPLLFLPVMQLASSLFQTVTIFREKMAHIDDSQKLLKEMKTTMNKCINLYNAD